MQQPSGSSARRMLVWSAAVFALLAGRAAAQAPAATQPGVQQQTIEQEQRPTKPDFTPRPPAEIEKPEEKAPQAAEPRGPRVLVKKFRITGNTVIKTEKLEALAQPDEGKQLNLEQLRAVATRITEYYRDQGYLLAYAYLPPQDVREGTIEIALLEGEVGEIEVTGTERYFPEVVQRALTRVKNQRIIHEGLLETAINDLNEYPGLNVRASLKPGEKRGTTDIIMTAQERLGLSAGADVDNYGSRFSGMWRFGADMSYGSLSGLGDKLAIRGILSDDHLYYLRLNYQFPVGGYGTKLGANFVYSETGVGEELKALDAIGYLQMGGVEIIQPYLRTSGFNLQFFGGLDIKRIDNDVLNVSAGSDDLRVFRLGFNGDYRDRMLGRTYFGMTYYQGVPWVGGNHQDDPGSTKTGAPGFFSKATFDLARIQSLIIGGSYVVLRGFAQLSSQDLISVEQYSIGGYYTVRGYPLAERAGEQGYSVNAELVVPVPYLREWLQAAAFVDHAAVFPVSPNRTAGEKEHYLTGVGGGLRLNVPVPYVPGGVVQVRLDYGYAIGPNPTNTTNRITHKIDRGIIYLASSFRF